jgi:hypothetical protein
VFGGRRHGRRLPQIGPVGSSRRTWFHLKTLQFACIRNRSPWFEPARIVSFSNISVCVHPDAARVGRICPTDMRRHPRDHASRFFRNSSLRGGRCCRSTSEKRCGNISALHSGSGHGTRIPTSRVSARNARAGCVLRGRDPSRFPTFRWLRRSTGDKLRPRAARADVAGVPAHVCTRRRPARAATLRHQPIA